MPNPSEACVEIRAALPLYVGGDLDPEELTAVRAHLGDCPECGGAEERARAARAVLLSRAAEEAQDGAPELWPGVRELLVAEGRLAPASRGPRPLAPAPAWSARWSRTWLGSGAAAAALLLAFGIAQLSRPSDGARLDRLGSGALVETAPAVSTLTNGGPAPVTPVVAPAPAGRLRHVGETGVPLHWDAVDVLPEQGIVVRQRQRQPSLVGGPPRLIPERD